jgi:hypothetical protein
VLLVIGGSDGMSGAAPADNPRFVYALADADAREPHRQRADPRSCGHLRRGAPDHVERRITTVEEKGDRHFTWLWGLQMTMMLAVIGVLLAAYLR